jgi:hypothetical protein
MLTVEVLTDGEGNGDKAALVRLIERQVRRLGSLHASLPAGNQADGRRTPADRPGCPPPFPLKPGS